MVWYWLISMILPPAQSDEVNAIANLHPLIVMGIILTAATVEELFYRGYLIERFHELTGRCWVGVIISCSEVQTPLRWPSSFAFLA